MKGKIRLITIILALLLAFTLFGCAKGGGDKSITLSVRDAKYEFVIGEEFSLGEKAVVSKIVNMNITKAEILALDNIELDFSSFDNTKEGNYGIIVKLKGTEYFCKYYVTVKKPKAVVEISYNGGTIYRNTPLSDIILTLSENSTKGVVTLDSNQELLLGVNLYKWTFIPTDSKYSVVNGEISLTVVLPKIVLQELKITSPPSKLTYNAFEYFDKSGLAIEGVYSDGTKEAITDYNIINDTKKLTADKTFMEVKVGEVVVKIDIVVNKIKAVYGGAPIKTIQSFYKNTLKNITLPSNFVWKAPDTILSELGSYEFEAYYIPDNDEINYIKELHTIKVNVQKATPTLPTIENLVAEYGQILSSVILPNGYVWQNSNSQNSSQVLKTLGEHNFIVDFIPADEAHYNRINDISVVVTTTKANKTYDSLPTGVEIEYNKKLSEVSTQLTNGFRFQDGAVVAKEIGLMTVMVSFTYQYDTEYYNTIENISLTITVTKASSANQFNKPSQIEAFYGEVLSLKSLPQGFSWKTPTDKVGIVNALGTDGSRIPNTHTAIFTPQDTEHYRNEEVDINIFVSPINSNVTVDRANGDTIYESMVFDHHALTLAVKTNANAENTGTVKFDAGQTLKAGTFTYNWTFTPDTLNFKTQKGSLSLTAVKTSVQGVTLDTLPNLRNYNAKDTLNTQGLALSAQLNDGKTAPINQKTSTVDGYTIRYQTANLYITGNDKFVYIDYQGYSFDVPITVYKLQMVEGIDYTLPTNITANYNDILQNVSFQGAINFSWNAPTLNVGSVGIRDFYATVLPTDQVNYAPKDVQISVKILPINPTFNLPQYTASYLDCVSTLTIPVFSNGVFSFNERTFVFNTIGEVTIYATFTPNDSLNYNTLNSVAVIVSVNKKDTTAQISYTGVEIYAIDDPNLISLNVVTSSVPGTAKLVNGQTLSVGTVLYNWIFTPTDIAHYNTTTGTISLNVNLRKLISLHYEGVSAKSFKAREVFDTTGITVFANYNNGDKVALSNSQYLVTYQGALGENDILHGGDTKVCFTYQGLSVDYTFASPIAKQDSVVSVEYNGSEIRISNVTPPKANTITLTITSTNNQGSVSLDGNITLTIGTNSYVWTFTPQNTLDYKNATGNINITALLLVDDPKLVVKSGSFTATFNTTSKKFEIGGLSFQQLRDIVICDSDNNTFEIRLVSSLTVQYGAFSDIALDLYFNNIKMYSIILNFVFYDGDYINYLISSVGEREYSSGASDTAKIIAYSDKIFGTMSVQGKAVDLFYNNIKIDNTFRLNKLSETNFIAKMSETIFGQNIVAEYGLIVRYKELQLKEITIGTTVYEITSRNMVINHYSDDENLVITYATSGTVVSITYEKLNITYTVTSGMALARGLYDLYIDATLSQNLRLNIARATPYFSSVVLQNCNDNIITDNLSKVSSVYTRITNLKIYSAIDFIFNKDCSLVSITGTGYENIGLTYMTAIMPIKTGDIDLIICVNNNGVNENYYVKLVVENISYVCTFTIGNIVKTFNYDIGSDTQNAGNDFVKSSDGSVSVNIPLSLGGGTELTIAYNLSVLGLKKSMEDTVVLNGTGTITAPLVTVQGEIKGVCLYLSYNKYIDFPILIYLSDTPVTL